MCAWGSGVVYLIMFCFSFVASPSEIEQLLFDMHLWAYFGMLKMGILCAVLMRNEGHHAKRCAMLDLGPKLLSFRILSKAKELLTQVKLLTLYLFLQNSKS